MTPDEHRRRLADPPELDDYWTPEEIARTLWALHYIADVWAAAYGPPAWRVMDN